MIVEAMKGYRAADLPKDAVAGLVIAALSVPICPHRICEDEFFRLTGLTRKEADL